MAQARNAVCNWSIRFGARDTPEERKEELKALKLWCSSNCKKWAFQLEKGDEKGYVHWQMMVSLFTKERQSTLWTSFQKGINPDERRGNKLSPLSTENGEKFTYCMKDQTRQDGPWTDETEAGDMPSVIIRDDVKDDMDVEEKDFYHWQKEIVAWAQTKPSKRLVRIIVDPKGEKGKSYLKKWMMIQGLATIAPAMAGAKDLLQFVCSMTKNAKVFPKCFIIDIPRGMKDKQLREFWSAIESIKDGYVYDTRYKAMTLVFKSPHILIMTNAMPPFGVDFSSNRWEIGTLDDGMNLALRVLKRAEDTRADEAIPEQLEIPEHM